MSKDSLNIEQISNLVKIAKTLKEELPELPFSIEDLSDDQIERIRRTDTSDLIDVAHHIKYKTGIGSDEPLLGIYVRLASAKALGLSEEELALNDEKYNVEALEWLTKRKTAIVKHTKRLEEYIGKEKSDKLEGRHFDLFTGEAWRKPPKGEEKHWHQDRYKYSLKPDKNGYIKVRNIPIYDILQWEYLIRANPKRLKELCADGEGRWEVHHYHPSRKNQPLFNGIVFTKAFATTSDKSHSLKRPDEHQKYTELQKKVRKGLSW